MTRNSVSEIWLSLREFMAPEECERFLRSPQPLLNNRVPIDLLDTEHGPEEVRVVIARLRNGDFE